MSQNQQQQPGGFFDKNTVMAIALSFAVFFAWNAYISKKYPKKPADTAAATAVQPSGPQTNSGEPKPAPGTAETSAPNVQKPTTNYQEQTLAYDSEFFHVDITSKGMGFKTLVLKQYTDRKNNPVTYNQEQFLPLGASLINDQDQFAITKTADNVFEGVLTGQNMQAKKTIVIDPKKYTARTTITITSAEKKTTRVQTFLQGSVDEVKSSMFLPSYEHQEILLWNVEKKNRQKLSPSKAYKAEFSEGLMAGFSSQYFALALKAHSSTDDPKPKVEGFSEGTKGGVSFLYESTQPVDQYTVTYDFYFGPKDITTIRAADDTFAAVIDYGFFGFIGKPLHAVLLWVYNLVSNWGLAIVILTVILRTAMLPLNYYSFKSMKKMQAIQPKLTLIKEKYKNDPARVNQETLQLMRAEKANPLSGCIPALLQIPIFFAFYAMIASSFELYKQPFIFWIHDLTLKDPFFILPVAGSLVFFIQQKLTPPSPGMDPAQQKMLMFMPLFITVFMLGTPSGLSLYFFVNALCGFAQQMYFMKSKTT